MDKASLIGLIIGAVCLGIACHHTCHGNWGMFYSSEGVLLVLGGSVSVIFMSMPLDKVMSLPGYLKKFMFNSGLQATEVIQLMNTLAEKARRDGILALESETASIKDPFLAAGMKMAIDGVDPGAIEGVLRMEVLAMQERHKAGKKFFDLVKVYGPGWGLVGTLIGQLGMFGKLATADIGELGAALMLAVGATLYGAFIANAVAGPMGEKMALKSGEEILGREMMIQGILSIQAGDNPRITLDKMLAFIPSPGRAKFRQAV
ncbi:motility protein A [Phycisphaerae bacterium]|jgi:chemotaxis protein MotA|nr:motility protein A [Phycisphaerae bacterium]